MKTRILAFVFIAVVLNVATLTEAAQKPCRRQCRSEIRSQIVCAQDRDGRNCRKLKECELREVNCRLRSRKQPMLLQTYMQRCRLIKGTTGQNKCAHPRVVIRKPRFVRDCNRYRCTDNNKRACYRPSKGDICQLLTACQAERANCQRRWKNQLLRVDDKQCKSLKPGKMGQCAKLTPSKKKWWQF